MKIVISCFSVLCLSLLAPNIDSAPFFKLHVPLLGVILLHALFDITNSYNRNTMILNSYTNLITYSTLLCI
jgi:hypothetical protein